MFLSSRSSHLDELNHSFCRYHSWRIAYFFEYTFDFLLCETVGVANILQDALQTVNAHKVAAGRNGGAHDFLLEAIACFLCVAVIVEVEWIQSILVSYKNLELSLVEGAGIDLLRHAIFFKQRPKLFDSNVRLRWKASWLTGHGAGGDTGDSWSCKHFWKLWNIW